ncbi:A/G-specific adenine glycosylase [bacterium]|nr:MAG: A/G-specific adenine glycosylase [bacterium]
MAATLLARFGNRPAARGAVKSTRSKRRRTRNKSSSLAISEVRGQLLAWYGLHGRRLPWRERVDPYRVLVSEMMLQQTQAERVVPKFEAFLERFPTAGSLASSAVAEVVRLWQGLGYNRRAVRLHAIARAVVERHGGEIPRETGALLALPGIGRYTAAALRAFAFNADAAPLDTNIRRVIHRLAFGLEHPPRAGAAALERVASELVAPGRGREWNSALMDLGATVCTARAPKCLVCPLRDYCAAAPIDPLELQAAAKAHAPARGPQARLKFVETTRYARGRIVEHLRGLPHGAGASVAQLADLLGRPDVSALVAGLERDGLAAVEGECVRLP